MPLDLALEKLLRDHRHRVPPPLQESDWVSRANARGCHRTVGARSIAGCFVRAKKSEWEGWDGTRSGSIRPCSTSTAQT
jgi:hypothetical protein